MDMLFLVVLQYFQYVYSMQISNNCIFAFIYIYYIRDFGLVFLCYSCWSCSCKSHSLPWIIIISSDWYIIIIKLPYINFMTNGISENTTSKLGISPSAIVSLRVTVLWFWDFDLLSSFSFPFKHYARSLFRPLAAEQLTFHLRAARV